VRLGPATDENRAPTTSDAPTPRWARSTPTAAAKRCGAATRLLMSLVRSCRREAVEHISRRCAISPSVGSADQRTIARAREQLTAVDGDEEKGAEGGGQRRKIALPWAE